MINLIEERVHLVNKEIVILAAKRTAIGSFAGMYKDIPAVELGRQLVKATIKAAQLSPEDVDQLIFGNVLGAGLGQNIARQVSIHAGIPVDRTAFTVNMVCGSGLQAIQLAFQALQLGEAEVVVAGGCENMSQAPYLLQKERFGARLGDGKIVDSLLKDGLLDSFSGEHMGVTAEHLAKKYGISRERQDQFALASQHKAQVAMEEGRFKEEIVPIHWTDRKGQEVILKTDEHPRKDLTLDQLARLKPAFLPQENSWGVTAGNSSGINDGAACLVMTTLDYAKAHGLKVMAKISDLAFAGVAPDEMGLGPVASCQKLLQKNALDLSSIDCIELNEAFAAQALAVLHDLGLSEEQVNPNGGAIALGHPIGASGARIVVTLLHEMLRSSKHLGLASLCIGGGQGGSILLELKS